MVSQHICMHPRQNSIHRANFLEELVRLVPDENVSFRNKVQQNDQLEYGVKMIFQDGSTATASAVVGCDRIKNNTCQVLLGKGKLAARAVLPGRYAYCELIPM